jgi:hypothetical protein
MTNAYVRGGRKGLGYASFLGVESKKNYGFCGSRPRFFIYKVGGGGS